MEYRAIGKTGLRASAVGLGAEHLDGKPFSAVQETVDAALAAGINIIDVFMPGAEVRQNIGRALGPRRKEVLLQGHIGSVDLNQQYDISRDAEVCRRYFEDLLKHLDTDYIDFGMLFFIDSEEAFSAIFDNGIVDYAQRLKKQGVIRAIGASSHNPVIAEKLVESGLIDLLMFSINPAFDLTPEGVNALERLNGENFAAASLAGIEPARARLYRRCVQKDVAITVMKTLGAGKLLSAEHSPFGAALSVGQCIHYALSRPAVVSCLIGCQSAAQVREATGYFQLSDGEKDYTTALAAAAKSGVTGCVYCNHCLPCPAGIDIAAVNRYLDIAKLDKGNIPPSVAMHYRGLPAAGADCVACGSCEGKCPFAVPVMENMREAAALFG